MVRGLRVRTKVERQDDRGLLWQPLTVARATWQNPLAVSHDNLPETHARVYLDFQLLSSTFT